jgi:hypothetical protein
MRIVKNIQFMRAGGNGLKALNTTLSLLQSCFRINDVFSFYPHVKAKNELLNGFDHHVEGLTPNVRGMNSIVSKINTKVSGIPYNASNKNFIEGRKRVNGSRKGNKAGIFCNNGSLL